MKGGRVICGARGYDGALNGSGDCICVDCWAGGQAAGGYRAVTFVPADVPYPVHCPDHGVQKFHDACNRHLDAP